MKKKQVFLKYRPLSGACRAGSAGGKASTGLVRSVAVFLTTAVIVLSFFSCSGGKPAETEEPGTTAETVATTAAQEETSGPAFESKIAQGLWEKALELERKSFDTLTTCGASSHLQGICVDDELKYMYFSYTDVLAKLDMSTGELVGSVGGFGKGSFGTSGGAHLGCIAYYDGKIYGSLEYKEPGKKFFVCVFNENAITDPGMDMKQMESGVDAVLLYEPTADFRDPLGEDVGSSDGFAVNEKIEGHRFGCSGIDGITFGRLPGSPDDSPEYMMVAYGIYGAGDWVTERYDNDYNIIQVYDPDDLTPERLFRFTYERGLSPDYTEDEVLYAVDTLFVFTGNTRYGTQNLEYERDTGNILLCTYGTRKETFPGCSLFVIDGSRAPDEAVLQVGQNYVSGDLANPGTHKIRAQQYKVDGGYPLVKHCSLLKLEGGFFAEKVWGRTGVYAAISGRDTPASSTTGIVSLGGGYWYIADGATSVSLYRSDPGYGFEKVK